MTEIINTILGGRNTMKGDKVLIINTLVVKSIFAMKTNRLFLLLTLTFVFTSCSETKESATDGPVEFKTAINVMDHLSTLPISASLLESFGLVSNDQYLFSLNYKSSPIVKVFNHRTGEFLGAFGTIGGGPGEFERVNLSGFSRRQDQIVVSGQKNIRSYDIAVDENGIAATIKLKATIPGEYFPFNYAFFLNDSTVAGKRMLAERYFSVFNVNTGEMSGYGDYPNLEPQIPKASYHHLYQSQTRMHPDGSKIAGVFSNFPLLRIIDTKANKSKEVFVLPENEQREVVAAPDGRSIQSFDLYKYFKRIQVNENLIAAYYCESEIVPGPEGGNRWISSYLTDHCLLIFDWEGAPVLKFIIEDWMTRFTVTPDNRVIFFHPEEKDELYLVDLNRWID